MSTEIILKPKKKFSIGGLLCIFAAFAVSGFMLVDIFADAISIIPNALGFVRILGYEDYIYYVSQAVYLSCILGAMGAILKELCLLITVASLILYGALTLFKIKTRFLGVIFIAPAAASLLAILIMVLSNLVQNSVWLVYSASIALSNLLADILFVVVASAPFLAMAACWIVLAAVVLALGGSREYSKTRSTVAIIVAAVVALLFAGASAVGFGAVLLNNGMILIRNVTEMVLYGYMMSWSYTVETLLSILGSTIYAAVKYGALGIVYAVTTFFAVKWIVAPYKKVK